VAGCTEIGHDEAHPVASVPADGVVRIANETALKRLDNVVPRDE
jgi:hypothetical protein